jgi:hypothetical protein
VTGLVFRIASARQVQVGEQHSLVRWGQSGQSRP